MHSWKEGRHARQGWCVQSWAEPFWPLGPPAGDWGRGDST